LNVPNNLGILIVLAIVGLLLPLCERKPRGNDPSILDLPPDSTDRDEDDQTAAY
jgi:hypothetical protein